MRSFSVRRAYANSRFGQAHLRIYEPVVATGKPPLACLHATPWSGAEFGAFAEAMAHDRIVVCPDNPGFGGSDRPRDPPELADYAGAIGEAVAGSGVISALTPIDVLGTHTGAAIAVELATRQSNRVRRIVLAGVPMFDAALRADLMARYVKPVEIFSNPAFVPDTFRQTVMDSGGREPERALELFIERLRAGVDAWWASRAVFAYDVGAVLRRVRQRTLLIALPDGLPEPTRRAASYLSDAVLIDLEQRASAHPWDTDAALLSDTVREFLDSSIPG